MQSGAKEEMTPELKLVAPASEPPAVRHRSVDPAVARSQTERRAAQEEISADLRLVIEEDPASGAYVYKTLDRNTGEVVSQLPREEVLKLREAPDYRRGAVIDTRA